MEIELKRIAKRSAYTIGRLTIDGKYFCDTLEPTWRNIGEGKPGEKIAGKTAIPEGRYPVAITKSIRFGKWLPLLLNVPMFSGIRIHAGNTAADTQGCILVGENKEIGKVINSRETLKRLIQRMTERMEGEAMWITVK
ncbi:MAG: DUF5675 family protein [Prevotellaceae bacterium]|nr:DUF5675 family protein [Prevotellaceae bacterium]